MANEQCTDSFFDNCDDNKKHWTFEQLWKKLTAKITGSDCPALRVSVASISETAGTQRSVTSNVINSDGSVPLGARWINFNSDSDFVGTINGKDFAGSMNFMMPPMGNDTYGAVPYTRTAGTMRVDYAS